MASRSKLAMFAGCLLLGLLTVAPGRADTYSGSLTTDDQVVDFSWTLSQASNVVISTSSYATGGFVPIVSLFDQTSGAFIAGDGADASCSHGRMTDSTTGICNDAYLSTSLAAGNYLVALTEFYNYPAGSNISDGFSEQGQGNFTSSVCAGASGPFWETDLSPCAQRTGNYSVSLSATATPEPATIWLSLPALAIFVYRAKRLKSRSRS